MSDRDTNSLHQCPLCRNRFRLPSGGVKSLRTNFFISELRDYFKDIEDVDPEASCVTCQNPIAVTHCLNCEHSFCVNCTTVHSRNSLTKGHHLISMEQYQRQLASDPESLNPAIYCEKHPGEPLQMYCASCEIPVCSTCATEDHPDPEHKQKDVDAAAEEEKNKMKELTDQLNDKLKTISENCEALRHDLQELIHSCYDIDKHIDYHCKMLTEYIIRQREEKKSELYEIFRRKKQLLETQLQIFCIDLTTLRSAREFVQQPIDSSKAVLYLKSLPNMKQSVDDLIGKEIKAHTSGDGYLDFSPNVSIFDEDVGELHAEENVAWQFHET
ncbi:transcription intermediary factor 1-beta-like [Glandiceps talaboti]